MAQPRSLRLTRETLTELTLDELSVVAGGVIPNTLQKTCPIPSLDGCLTGVYPTFDGCTR